MKGKNLQRLILGLTATLLFLLLPSSTAQRFPLPFSEANTNVVIITGENALSSDIDAAHTLARELNDTRKRNAAVVTDTIFAANTTLYNNSTLRNTNIIAIGGPCVNMISAQVMGLEYPTCGATFEDNTDLGAGQYGIRIFNSTYTNDNNNPSRIIAVIAGYDASDTRRAVDYILSRPVGLLFRAGTDFRSYMADDEDGGSGSNSESSIIEDEEDNSESTNTNANTDYTANLVLLK